MSGNGNQNQQRPPAPRPAVVVPSAAVASASVPPQGQEPAGAAAGEGGGEGAEKVTPEVVQTPSAQVEAPPPPPAEIIPRGHTKVYPIMTVQRVRIGPEWYQFIMGKACTVPTQIIPLLVEKKIIPPQG